MGAPQCNLNFCVFFSSPPLNETRAQARSQKKNSKMHLKLINYFSFFKHWLIRIQGIHVISQDD